MLNNIKHEWEFIGEILGIAQSTIKSYKQQQIQHRECLVAIFHEWREKVNQDENMHYQHNWEGLYYLLQDIQQSEEANTLKSTLLKLGYRLQVRE